MAGDPDEKRVGKEHPIDREFLLKENAIDAGLLGWAVGFGLATFGIAALLDALQVPWKITLAWTLLSWGILVSLEPGLISILLRPPEALTPRKRRAKTASPTPKKSGGESTSKSETQDPTQDSSIEGPEESERATPAGRHEPVFWIEEFRLLRRTSYRRMLELSLMIALAELGFAGSRAMRPITQPTVKLSDADKSALCKCLDHCCDKTGGDNAGNGDGRTGGGGDRGFGRGGGFGGNEGTGNGTPSQTTLRIAPELEKALQKFLEKQQESRGSPFPWGIAGVVVVILIAAAIIVAGRVAKEHPATAAPLGAAGLAAAAIKEADHLSRLDPSTFYVVLALFAAAGVFAAWFGWRETRRGSTGPVDADGTGEQKKPEGGSKLVESPMNTLFSVAILLWAVMVVCYRVSATPKVTDTNPPVQKTSIKMTATELPPIKDFSGYSADVPQPDQAIADLASSAENHGARSGDLLILLGSADCQAIHAPGDSNEKLAGRRANAVRDLLVPRHLIPQESILAKSLEQYNKCKESGDLRAVFPILIHTSDEGTEKHPAIE